MREEKCNNAERQHEQRLCVGNVEVKEECRVAVVVMFCHVAFVQLTVSGMIYSWERII